MEELAPDGVRRQDLSVLIGILAYLEAILMADEMPDHQSEWLRRRFAQVGLLDQSASLRDLRQALNDMNHRLRNAAGEMDEPPEPTPVPG